MMTPEKAMAEARARMEMPDEAEVQRVWSKIMDQLVGEKKRVALFAIAIAAMTLEETTWDGTP